MNGRTLVIGLIIFVLIVVAAIYFAMTAEFNKDKPVSANVEVVN